MEPWYGKPHIYVIVKLFKKKQLTILVCRRWMNDFSFNMNNEFVKFFYVSIRNLNKGITVF